MRMGLQNLVGISLEQITPARETINGQIQQRAREKLKYLDSAADLRDLLIPPSNLLEAMKGDRKGQHSIRINKQWRLCFKWKDGDAFDVEIVDYH
jgi:toxin HigB-1